MEKRVVAAIALSIAVLLAFKYFLEPPPVKETAPITRPAPVPPPQPPQPPPQAVPAAEPAAAFPAEEEVPGRQIVVECSLYRAVLDNRGGVLTGWQLKQYKTAKGELFDMIPAAHMEERPYPGSLTFDDPSLTASANQQNYSVEIVDGKKAGAVLTAPATVVMRLRRGDLAVEKRFRFDAANYLVSLSTTFQRGTQPLRGRILLGQDIGPEPEHLLNPSLNLMAVSDLGGGIQRDAAPKDENEVKQIAGDVRWFGLDMQYFAEIAVPAQPVAAFEIQRRPVQAVGLGGEALTRNLLRMTVPADGSAVYRIYLGPKIQSHLAAVPGADLSGVIDYGTYLGIIVKPLFLALRFINQYTKNYGMAIILLTFALTLVLFPLRLKQMVSMKKMQVLQPKIKDIQERYKRYKKTDPKRAEMNQEVMALYKEHKVNPLGGCLPLILQMPLLFAFYRLLSISIELRQAPFVGWLHDLSAKDPYYILPIVMGITMLISQKMTPMAPGTDPTQAKMMLLMPVVFTFFFLNVSSGLNLYFLCSNVFQIAFQKVAERWVGDKGSVRKSKS
ncbi:MAG: membrane protein insertase YidC [Acidobacteriia bacterium]|nr:membrane protein insertase YidC [Terriglobia bacterium]